MGALRAGIHGAAGWRSLVWLLPVCLAGGIAVGRWWRGIEPAHAYTEAPPDAHAVARASGPPSFAPVVERAGPGVVTVLATKRFDDTNDAADATSDAEHLSMHVSHGVLSGSGFIVDANGVIVTARHLVRDTNRITVEVQNLGVFDATVAGEDEITDLAVLQLVQAPSRLPKLELGRSEDLRAGDWIVAVGNPFGFRQTVTAGVVSYVGRHLKLYDLRVTNDFLQFSAPVNPGSSGCPVLDWQGNVVGVTTQAAGQAQGIFFAIPSRTLKWVLDKMQSSADGRVHRGYLGISFISRLGIDDDGKPLEGAQVQEVAEGEAAHRAGLQRGDVVLYVDDKRIADASDLYERITRAAPGTLVRLTLLRDGAVRDPVEVVLRDAMTAAKKPDPAH
jgi:serine protease Do